MASGSTKKQIGYTNEDRDKAVSSLIDEINSNKDLSSLTKKELAQRASDMGKKDYLRDKGGLDSQLRSIREEMDEALSGTNEAYVKRQQIQERIRMQQEKPGVSRQTILSRNSSGSGGRVGNDLVSILGRARGR